MKQICFCKELSLTKNKNIKNNKNIKINNLNNINDITRTIIRKYCWNITNISNNQEINYSINGLAKSLNYKINITNKYINFVKEIMNATSLVIPYTFKYVTDYNDSILDFNFVNSQFLKNELNYTNIYGVAMPPGNSPWKNGNNKNKYSDGNIYINQSYFKITDFKKNSFLFTITLHELGHALGLSHPHDTGGNSTIINGVKNAYHTGKLKQNDFIYTVMTYVDIISKYGPKKNVNYGYINTWMSYDIAALQYLYGTKTNSINNTYNIKNNQWTCISDTGGTNTISAINMNKGVTINLNNANLNESSRNAGGYISTANNKGGITLSKNSIINRAIGSKHNDIIHSNLKNNIISSGGGKDKIYAVNGKINSGTGNDTIFINRINNTRNLIINGNKGKNKVIIKARSTYFKSITVKTNGQTILKKDQKSITISNITILKFNNKQIKIKKFIRKSKRLNQDIIIK